MKLIDTDTINHILTNKTSFNDECFVALGVSEEMSVVEIVYNRKIPDSVKSISRYNDFDEVSYLKNYYDALNKYNKRSFFNMKGFGDVSIIATVNTIIQNKKSRPNTLPLPGFSDEIEVYTGDGDLKKFLKKEFGNSIKVLDKTNI